MEEKRQQKRWESIAVRAVASVLIIAAGISAMRFLAKRRKPPTEAEIEETAIHVEAMTVSAGSYPVFIVGFGEATPLNVSVVSCEVSGRVVEVNPRLEPGECLQEGDLIARIDDRDYRAAQQEAVAMAKQLEGTITRLKLQLRYDKERLDLLVKNRDLAKTEFERARKLLTESRVGSQAGVDAAERILNTAAAQVVTLQQSLELQPVQLVEAEQSLEAAKARLARATLNLERCTVKAPFTCRVKSAAIELGQLASPNQPLATLADDSVLEIHIPVDSVDARKWLTFTLNEKPPEGNTWFAAPRPVSCRIRWTEDLDGHSWQGSLHRVVAFSSDTRTLVLAVRVHGATTVRAGVLPLTEGMFCRVEIPGREVTSVFRVPRAAVTFEGELHTVKSNRLATVRVAVEYVDDAYSYISSGLVEGNPVITTRLIAPLEGSLLDVTLDGEADDS